VAVCAIFNYTSRFSSIQSLPVGQSLFSSLKKVRIAEKSRENARAQFLLVILMKGHKKEREEVFKRFLSV
jgi:hypothetical protein